MASGGIIIKNETRLDDWRQLIDQCRRGRPRAERALFDHYGDRCYALAYRYLRDRMEAEDVVAMAFVKIFRALPQAEFPHRNGFEAWLRRIVVNEALSLIRRRKPLEALEDHPADLPVTTGAEIIGRLTAQELASYIEALPEGYRLVLTLHAIEGYTHAEIGARLGISEGTSKSQLSKARKVLRKQLGKRHHYAS